MNQNLYIYYFFICCLSNSLCNKKFSWDRLFMGDRGKTFLKPLNLNDYEPLDSKISRICNM